MADKCGCECCGTTPEEVKGRPKGIDLRSTPSQAEGDRDTIEQDLSQKAGKGKAGGTSTASGTSTRTRAQGEAVELPSQAEGERDAS